ncbi:fat-like cadherin-related tumor suppressor homolog [Condylostylus longicornis]|uniref:fat-like cadherin-related tumor suppressor homolog n=1 Tax=Condylostylus longicornis TaxID=2530218 RepID=UPI00244DFB4F|nr:fat-like cadherin-related tumor suppressor homolog [Condylostylus longicornis]
MRYKMSGVLRVHLGSNLFWLILVGALSYTANSIQSDRKISQTSKQLLYKSIANSNAVDPFISSLSSLPSTSSSAIFISTSTTSSIFNKQEQQQQRKRLSQLDENVQNDNVNDHTAYVFKFDQPLYNVTIPENSVGKTYALQPPNEDRLGIRVIPNLDVKFRIVSGDRDKLFKAEERLVGDFVFLAIRTRTGIVILNREKTEEYKLGIKALATQFEFNGKHVYECETTVILKVLDRNDLSPLFYPTEYMKTVPEDMPLHKSILKVMAEDADLGINGEIYYSFLDDNDYFAIHPTSGVISLTRNLKYVEKSLHELTVLATDRGTGANHRLNQASKAKVTIKVEPVNLFTPDIYVQALPEIFEGPTANIYGIVRVTDKDLGIHGEIKSLEIVNGDPDGHFRIVKTDKSGEYNIEIQRLLDRERTPLGYNLTLRAVDNGIPPQSSYKIVPVHLADINDNAPVFNREIYEVSVPETSPPNTPVIRLKVTDRDQGKNALVFLEIVGGNEGGEFRINPDTGMLYTQKLLDAETKAFYTLTVSAIDQGNSGMRMQSSAKVKINVQDTNDNDPVFENINKTIWIDENEPSGTTVTKVTARDRDSGENAYISYSIANLNDVPFDIDHFSGVVRTSKLIDYESMRREYILSLRASDWGLPYRRQTEMELIIRIRDVNDNRPQFERVDCIGHIPRELPIGTEILTLSAIDFDSGNYISYRLISGNEDNCFNLDPTSGVISIGCDLIDIGTDAREVNVTATDGTHFADVMTIKINLINAKRNFAASGSVFPNQMNRLGQPVEESSHFECRDTGVIRRQAEILAAAEKNNMPGREYNARDDFVMMPSRYGENQHTPEFVEFPNELRINETVALGTTVGWIKARDRDLGYNGKLVFGISDGDHDSVFRIDPETGELQIIGYLDREREDEYVLNVTVYDLGKPQKSLSKMLPIFVIDENDNPPKFSKSLASFRVTENAINGTIIFQLNATDADLGENAAITYTMVTDTDDFQVDPKTGILFVNNRLDRERQEIYELRIRATDGGVPNKNKPPIATLHSDAIVRVSVDDINDNAPEFTLNEYTFRVREDIPRGTVIAIVSATDLDIGPSGEVLYSLSEDDDEEKLFKIDKYSGTIRTESFLDYEERQVHSLTVRAIDRGTPALSSEATVIIEIIDVNENRYAPEFQDFVLTGSILENQPPDTLVMNIIATDADPPGPDSKVSYSIRGGDGLGIFTISNDGSLKTLASLDIENKPHYWLTVCAQDQAVVPLHSCVQVYVQVLNENDNVPLTQNPVYYASIPEGSPAGKKILQLIAEDQDIDPNHRITYRIISGNPGEFFAINSTTGIISTTARKLDRENQLEHILEVSVSDNGRPQLSSTTRVVISVDDVNDQSPEFDQRFYKVQIPATAKIDQPLFQVLAIDNDSGENGRVTYAIKSGKGKTKFRIHPDTGVIYAAKPFEADTEYDLAVRAEDNGQPKRSHTTRVNVVVVPIPDISEHAPIIKSSEHEVEVTESDRPGFLVTLIQATDEDNEQLWYDIIEGDSRNEFYIGRDNGNVLLAKSLDWEIQKHYNLTISVTDGVHVVKTQLYVNVIDINDHRPEFTQSVYKVDISENIEEESEILQLHATDMDEDKKIFYTLHAARNPISLTLFRIDSITGNVIVTQRLDRELMSNHVLIVIAKDQGTPAKRNYAKIIITVHDHNDHAPEFSSRIIQGKVYETAALGTKIVQLLAVDRDLGENAKILYSIVSGNIGNVFEIDPVLGHLTVAKELDINSMPEYMLQVKATDGGNPSMSSQIPVHIVVTMADNDPPRFINTQLAAEIYENLPIGMFVIQIEARSTSSVFYEIADGNSGDMFQINPSTGVITTKNYLDYEKNKFFNLSVRATNLASVSALCYAVVHILDQNDNVPHFIQNLYRGEISEAAPIASLVLALPSSSTIPLVIKAFDADSGLNALLHYDIVESLPKRYFHIDSTTGAIKTVMLLDHEKIPIYDFHVKVTDLGKPRLSSDLTARVIIVVTDVNDCAPVFDKTEYNVTLLLPTYQNVVLLQVNATDPDSSENSTLRYDIIEGNTGGAFAIDSKNGIITTRDVERMEPLYKLHVRASDGKYSKVVNVNIKVDNSENSGLKFQRSVYEGSISENSTKITAVTVVNVLGAALNEHIEFRILNPTDMFRIGLTSGAIETTGKVFDREVCDNYELIIEARSNTNRQRQRQINYQHHQQQYDQLQQFHNSNSKLTGINPTVSGSTLAQHSLNDDDYDDEKPRIAHVIVNVTILDINDNCPMFVNLPYYAVVSVDDPKGSVITKVHAVDLDSYENGEVRYEMKRGHGELFKVDRKTGEVTLKQSLEGHNRDYELLIAAYDGAITPCSTDVSVHVKVIDKSMPVFNKQFYSDTVYESIEIYSPLSVAIQADSPLGRKLIYTIVKGNEMEEFAVDFNTGAIYVVDELDYERKQSYELIIRATDSVSGVSAEVPVSILVQDVNDCPPEIEQDIYNVTVSEGAPFGTQILRLHARDNDTNSNGIVTYSIQTDAKHNHSEYFHMDSNEGIIYLKKPLDHETRSLHHFTVVATDQGVPSLSSTAHVWVTVADMNDNAPKFDQVSYSCVLSEHAKRGQFVTIVKASDPDYIDHDSLIYKIAEGNELQTYDIDQINGIITLINMQNFAEQQMAVLNVSVTDGVYTTFARVKINISPGNLHSPVFPHLVYDVKVNENQLAGRHVITVTATDADFGEYGVISYEIFSDEMKEYFTIDKDKGVVEAKISLDREEKRSYEIPIIATDFGGKSGFTTIKVKVGDENDNQPDFVYKEYKAVVNINQQINATIIKVMAVDLDDNQNSVIRYSIYDSQNSGIQNLFAINENSGELFFHKSLEKSLINQMFEFFIRANDGGKPSLHSDVPISILIVGDQEQLPAFEKKDRVLFISETSPPGTVITRVRLTTNISATFKIISGDSDDPQFSIDERGELMLAKTLDREQKDVHIIGVLAETTNGKPPYTAISEIVLHVQDENDNAPIFDSNPYNLILAENVDKGTSIMKITARDADSGSNGDIRYYLADDVGDLVNVFDIDVYSGWITTLVPLDKEQKSEYRFQVIGSDHGQPKHAGKTTVVIRLKDYNDSPPVFKQSNYTTSINEDAIPGTVLVQVATTDADLDLNTLVEYYIISGDPLLQFEIRESGELTIVKSLDRESVDSYTLEIVATDGKFTSKTKIFVKVLDANDNPPYCLRYRYRQTVNESVVPGTFILKVLATDADEDVNIKLRFYLTGNGSNDFTLDKDSGILKTGRQLDRETISKYSITAHVQDREHSQWECSSQIEILISDLNDNPPEFSMDQYTVTLPEDAEINTLVTKVHATDKDIGLNRKIRYSFIDSGKDHFKISPDTGIITLAKSLDRESIAIFNLSIKATDQGSPKLENNVKLIVNVQDINDNPPEFSTRNYFATVAEISPINLEVTKVLATSRDTGINAEIFYSIVGGNEQRKFQIDRRSGVVAVAGELDFEKTKDYFLTIQAVDGGTPPLSNLATLNISVTDSNDNTPQFLQNTYSARIREDAVSGDKILQVRAIDADSDNNGRISYFIERGDRFNQFQIDESTGYISVAGSLDRESISSYVLEIRASDNGVPALSNFVHVNIEISDANDNPPLFSRSNYSVVVQEDKHLGHVLLKFEISDADMNPNAAPYTFDFRSGNDGGSFRLEQDGTLRTATRFNHKVRNSYTLQIRVFDNGTPPLYSDAWVNVKVIEESQYPPVITPLDILVNSFQDEFPGGIIGKIFASDQDQYDTLLYDLAPTAGVLYSPNNLFNISREDGTLHALPNLDVGDYRVNVTVSDGKFLSFAILKITVELITPEMLENAVILRFSKVSPEDFILSHRKGFIRSIRTAMRSRQKDVVIISVQPATDDINMISTKSRISRSLLKNETLFIALSKRSYRFKRSIKNDLDIVFTVRKQQLNPSQEGYYTSKEITAAITDSLEEIEEATNLIVEEIVKTKCNQRKCANGFCKDKIILDKKNINSIATDVTSFVSARYRHIDDCECKQGYGGEYCDTIVNACANNPCPPFKNCVPETNLDGFKCLCPEGFTGPTCDRDVKKCTDDTCYMPVNPVSFSGKSYAQYKIDKAVAKKNLEDQLIFTLRVRTVQQTGNLMYAAGKIDYNILEIVNGVVQYRFDLGSGEGLISVSSIHVTDGEWHEIKLERERNSARLMVDGKHVAQGNAPGVNGILNLQSNEFFLGAEVRPHPSVLGFEDVQRGFIGCMDDIKMSREAVPLHMTGSSTVAVLKRFANVEFTCDAATVLVPLGICGTQPCFNGGVCKDNGYGNFECQCHPRFSGRFCKDDLDPCASSPCLFGGKCQSEGNSNYSCECPPRMTGKRCEFGRFCSPNPCRNGGVCEEGDNGPLCLCRGYKGLTCEVDVDECENQPCGNGATCINEAGSFRCICPPDLTGASCGDPLYSNSITTRLRNMPLEQVIGIAGGALGIVFLIITGVFCIVCSRKASSHHSRNINNDTKKDVTLNSVSPREEYKRSSKMSNLEIIQRPLSYTPASNNDQNYQCNNTVFVNNLDTLRSYGSAGDELENVPPEYQKLNRVNQQVNINGHNSDNESLLKQTWCDQMQLKTFTDNKLNNERKLPDNQNARLATLKATGIIQGRLLNVPMPNLNHSPNGLEDPSNIHGQYHWDCSDWARRSQNPLPDITEVPGSEVPDSSSFHSNESNESHPKHTPLPTILGPVDPSRDIETLNEEAESEFIGESESENSRKQLSVSFQNTSIPILNPLDSGSDDYRFSTVPLVVNNNSDNYLRHPNSYLPRYNIQSETDAENGTTLASSKLLNSLELESHQIVETDDEDDDVEVYGFPKHRNRRNGNEIDLLVKNEGLLESSSLLAKSSVVGGNDQLQKSHLHHHHHHHHQHPHQHHKRHNESNSDLSTQLCEIEDSEFDDDLISNTSTKGIKTTASQPDVVKKSVKWTNSVHQTEV